MNDSILRQAERHSEPEDSQSSVAHLLARLRAGQIDMEQVKTAAYFGHPIARLALSSDAPALGVEGWNDWCKAVALIIAKRVVLEEKSAPFDPHRLSFESPRGTNDSRRFRPPSGSMIRAQIGDLSHWVVEASYGEGEIVRFSRAPKTSFSSLAHFWLDAVRLFEEAEQEFSLGQTLRELGFGPCFPAKAFKIVESSMLGPNRRIAEFWDITPIVFGLAFDIDWNQCFYVWETPRDFLCYEWFTGA
ncbi:MAG: hypothetical protein P1V97_25905 [Planctomycetota bacterium]|nr:hypothetical protein [Planctomycetota bacterium]